MKITQLETWMANAGLRNYLFVRLRTDTGLTGIGEATLEWQEKTVQTLIHEWVEGRVLGRDPFDIEAVVGGMIRDQYQGGSHRDDRDQRRRDRALGHRRQGVRPARLPAARRTLPPAHPGLRQWLVRRREHPRGVRRAGAGGGRAGLSAGSSSTRSAPPGRTSRPRRANPRSPSSPPCARRSGRGCGLMIEFHGRLVGRQRPGDDPPLEPFAPDLVRGAGDAGQPRSAGRGQAADGRTARRRRAALHPGRLLPSDRAARRRRGADGRRPLRRDPGQQEDRRHGRRPGHADRAALLRSARSPWRPACTSTSARPTS